MSIFRINVWTSNKPQRYLFTIEDIPTAGWMYMYSFFAFKRYRPDTHRFDVVQKKNPTRSKISPLLLLAKEKVRMRRASQLLPEKECSITRTRLCRKIFSFYAYVDPKPGLSRINVQDMEDPDRHKITPRPPIGYWFQRLHFFGYSTSIWNVMKIGNLTVLTSQETQSKYHGTNATHFLLLTS